MNSDKKRHGVYRRIANPLFSQSFLRELEPTMLRYCQLFLNGLLDEAKDNRGVIDLTKWIDHLAFDVRIVSHKFDISAQWCVVPWIRFQSTRKSEI